MKPKKFFEFLEVIDLYEDEGYAFERRAYETKRCKALR